MLKPPAHVIRTKKLMSTSKNSIDNIFIPSNYNCSETLTFKSQRVGYQSNQNGSQLGFKKSAKFINPFLRYSRF